MSIKTTKYDYIEKCKKAHAVEWDYSRLDYKGLDEKVEIGCPIHGYFWQNAYSHSIGMGCKNCANDYKVKSKLLGKQEYVDRANNIHSSFFDYTNLRYKGLNTKGIITCPIHNDFNIFLKDHLKKGCPKCNIEIKFEKLRIESESKFFKKVKEVHPEGYTYPRFKYVNAHTLSIITCDIHGDFEQTPNIHIRGGNCKKCANSNVSKPEIEVQDFVKSLGFEIITNNRKIIKPLELDIFIPSLKKAIEFNGDWWHYNEKNPNSRGEEYHQNKTKMCNSLGIDLLHIRESEWINNRKVVVNQIKKLLKIQ